jgi:hypothetical protein
MVLLGFESIYAKKLVSIFSLLSFELNILFISVDIDNTKSIKWNNCVPVVMRLLGSDVDVRDDVPLQ